MFFEPSHIIPSIIPQFPWDAPSIQFCRLHLLRVSLEKSDLGSHRGNLAFIASMARKHLTFKTLMWDLNGCGIQVV